MRLRRCGVRLRLLCGLLLALLLPMASAWGQTATITAATGQSCAGTRFGSTLNCTAKDVIANITFTQPSATRVTSCLAGTTLTLDIIASLTSSSPDRYDLGIFTGESANDPQINNSSETCSIGLFPTSPLPFVTADTDTCGDFNGSSTAALLIQGVKTKCVSVTGSNTVSLPFLLSWDQNASGNSCNVSNIAPGTTSKCNASTAASIADIITLGYINLTKQTNPDGDTQSFAFTSTTSTIANTPQWTTLAGASTPQTLVDNQTKRITVPLSATGGTETLTITETLATFWEPGVTITCTAASGAAANPATVNNTTRTITANLTGANFGADCTITNTKRPKVTMVKQVGGRVNTTDQFTLTATGGGTLTDASGTTITAPVTVTTTGTATTAQTTFVSQPGQTLTITDTAASGTLSNYVTVYACTNALVGSSTVLPSGSTTTFTLTPAAGDDITCTYTNTPKPRLSLTKVLGGGGRAVSTDQFTLSITPGSGSNSFTTTGTGATVSGGPASLVGTSGVTYTLSEVAASGSLSNYAISYACTNTGTGGTTVTSGTSSSFTITPVNNDVLACTFANTRQSSPLTLAKTASVATLPAGGGTVTYTVTITNTDSVATSLDSLRDTLPSSPANATYVAGSAKFNGVAIADPGISGQTLTWNSTFTIPASASRTLTFDATLPATAGVYTNTAVGFIGTEQVDTTTSTTDNAPATVAVSVLQAPSLSKAFGASSVLQNGTTTLTLTLSNPNTSTALTGLAVTDTFPSGLQVAATPGFSNTCGGTVSPGQTAGNTSLVLSGGTLAANSTCQIQVTVTGTTAGDKVNTTGAVTSSNGGTGGTATATLQVFGPPSISKAFGASSVLQNGTTTLTLTISNPNTSMALTGLAVTDTFPSGLQVATTPGFSNTCSGTVSPGQSAGNASLVLSGGTLTASSTCQIQVTVTGTTAGTKVNTTNAVTSSNAGTGNTATSTLTVINGVSVSGTVYRDDNHNGTLDASEPVTGLTLFAKLLLSGATSQVATVSLADGTYTFSGVTPGSYTIILDTNNTPADITPTLPAGWIATEAPTLSRAITVSTAPLLLQNFGLIQGARLTGRVFQDTGGTGCTANNGVQETGTGCEQGLANVPVTLTNCGSTTYGSTAVTDSSGNYQLIIPSSVANGASLCVVETNLTSYVSTGGSAGTTGGTYTRTTDTASFTYTVGSSYSGVNFADVPVNTLAPDNQQNALPGTVVFYQHIFVAGSGGTVTFTVSSTANPSLPGWSQTLYQDTNCNAVLDSGESQLSGALSVTAGTQLCVLLKEFVPAAAPFNAQDQLTLSATFVYSNAVPALSAILSRTDLTTVGAPATTDLAFTKSVDKVTALPGEVITYTLTYSNAGVQPISTLMVYDTTPAFTVFVSATCGPTLPADLTGCTVSTQPAVNTTGALQWTFIGTLAPGGSGTVSYQVRIQ